MRFFLKHKAIAAALTFSLLSLGLVSCSKMDSNYEPIQVSGLNIIQASPTTELLDVYVDNSRANGSEFEFGSKIGYLSAFSGNRAFNVTKRGTSNSLKSLQHTLKPQAGYSLFVANTFANIEFLMLEDNLEKPATGKAKIRFVNLSPDGGTLSLNVNGAATDLVLNKAFKEYSTFEAVDAAESVTLNIKNSSGATESSITAVKLEDGKIYTVYAKGLKANTDDTRLSAKIFVHSTGNVN
ncbi:DUF4397 domain-containing protein [Pedobacter xixiisoli]|uniref:DUF4397 domain-containing protein n=1 Tax=Pedobacter xixiisoli TaxID=1476464 RepID=A0A286ACG2_9SPHI|nr:DUF4397 domain-containing protein [Pedobacter xixiisoli]SOD19596.1 protein of unknown function [Pedobacter xixiisoli]